MSRVRPPIRFPLSKPHPLSKKDLNISLHPFYLFIVFAFLYISNSIYDDT